MYASNIHVLAHKGSNPNIGTNSNKAINYIFYIFMNKNEFLKHVNVGVHTVEINMSNRIGPMNGFTPSDEDMNLKGIVPVTRENLELIPGLKGFCRDNGEANSFAVEVRARYESNSSKTVGTVYEDSYFIDTASSRAGDIGGNASKNDPKFITFSILQAAKWIEEYGSNYYNSQVSATLEELEEIQDNHSDVYYELIDGESKLYAVVWVEESDNEYYPLDIEYYTIAEGSGNINISGSCNLFSDKLNIGLLSELALDYADLAYYNKKSNYVDAPTNLLNVIGLDISALDTITSKRTNRTCVDKFGIKNREHVKALIKNLFIGLLPNEDVKKSTAPKTGPKATSRKS